MNFVIVLQSYAKYLEYKYIRAVFYAKIKLFLPFWYVLTVCGHILNRKISLSLQPFVRFQRLTGKMNLKKILL